jgi:hypothetical protein
MDEQDVVATDRHDLLVAIEMCDDYEFLGKVLEMVKHRRHEIIGEIMLQHCTKEEE